MNNTHLKNILTILEKQKIKNEDILNIYIYGSRCYGTFNNNSDYDIEVVLKTNSHNNIEIKGFYNLHINSQINFINNLKLMKIHELECIFSKKEKILKQTIDFKSNLKINKKLLRKSVSSKSNNSYVKAKKKIILKEENNFIGYKSLFHSLRILDFGTQIANNNKIIDFTSCNILWKEILNDYYNNLSYEELKLKYQPIYNEKKSIFKLSCPK